MANFTIYLLNHQVDYVLTRFNKFIEQQNATLTLDEAVDNSKNKVKPYTSNAVKISHIMAWYTLTEIGSSWRKDFKNITKYDISLGKNKKISAFLLITVNYKGKDYLYAITWGEAFRFFEKICVKEFGLLVTKKTINPNQITNASVIGQFALARSATATSHRPSLLDTLRMFDDEKFIKLSGRTDEESISITRISGKNSLFISQHSDIKNLSSALKKITKVYAEKPLNPDLSALENFTAIPDIEISAILPELQKQVNNGNFQISISENFVNIMESESSTFNLVFVDTNGHRKESPLFSFNSQEELESSLYDFFKKNKSSLELMNEHSIVQKENQEVSFPLEDAVNIFIEKDIGENDDKFTYTFSSGTWSRFKSNIKENIDKKLEQVKFYNHQYLPWNSGDICCEAGYNEKFAQLHTGLLIDAKLPKIKGVSSSFELADIAVGDKDTNRYIATKRIKNSSDVSYLFNQGVVSASAANKFFKSLNNSKSEIRSFLDKESSWYKNNCFQHDSKKSTIFSYLMVVDLNKYNSSLQDSRKNPEKILAKLPFFYKITILKTLEFHKNHGTTMEISFIPYIKGDKRQGSRQCRKCSVAGENFKENLKKAISGTSIEEKN